MKATSMVPIMIENARNLQPIVVYGDGNRLQNYIDVRDAAQLLIQAAIFSENMLTLGIGSSEYSNRDVALIIRELTQAEVIFEGTDSSVGFSYDDSDMHQRLGFEPKFKLMETIRDIIAI
jgi:nucleoside-diphosphate-sugar epimerase